MIYRVAACEIDTTSHRLTRDGVELHVEPQVFDLICFLAQRPGVLVSKDDLVEAVWNGLAVSDATIGARISAARKALGDDGARQEVLETVPRRGFRLRGGGAADAARTAALPSAEIRYAASADGAAIAWAEAGAGTPLIRIGHWLSHLELDRDSPVWGPTLARLMARHRLVRYDPRGTGLSQRDVVLGGLEMFVDDLEAVADAAALERFDLFAASQAVPVAVAFAARHPDRVRRMVLIGGYMRGRALRPPMDGQLDEDTMVGLVRAGWGQQGSVFLQSFTRVFMPDADAAQIASMAEMQTRTASAETAVAMRKCVDLFDVSGEVGKVGTPALIFHAHHDAVHPFGQGQALAAGLREARLVPLDSRNHVLLPQDREWPRVLAEMEAFLA